MSLGMMSEPAMARFDGICKTIAARGSGLTLQQIGDAGELARELERADPDMGRVELLRDQLGLEGVGAEAWRRAAQAHL